MEIRVGFEIAYAAAAPTPMVMMLSIHPSRRHDIIGTERIMAEPDVAIGFYRDSFGNIRLVRSGQWYTFDARHNHPRIGRILMGTGRDAADVALTTSFGRMNLAKFVVVSDEVVAA